MTIIRDRKYIRWHMVPLSFTILLNCLQIPFAGPGSADQRHDLHRNCEDGDYVKQAGRGDQSSVENLPPNLQSQTGFGLAHCRQVHTITSSTRSTEREL